MEGTPHPTVAMQFQRAMIQEELVDKADIFRVPIPHRQRLAEAMLRVAEVEGMEKIQQLMAQPGHWLHSCP